MKKSLPMTIVWLPVLLATFLIGCTAPKSAAPAGDDSLADAWRILSGKKFVDLTHTFSPTTPVWQGFGPATFSPSKDPVTGRAYTLNQDGFRASQYSLVGQYGTHIDPPAHFDGHGLTLDELPVKNMILPLIVFDMTPKLPAEPNHALTIGDILDWEKLNGRVPSGSFAALRTDMSKDWDMNPERFKRQPFPACPRRPSSFSTSSAALWRTDTRPWIPTSPRK